MVIQEGTELILMATVDIPMATVDGRVVTETDKNGTH